MLIVVKILLVAFAVFGQTKLFPERTASATSAESSLDSLVLPEEKPELALAQRAMEAQGLCRSAEKSAAAKTGEDKADPFALQAAAPEPGKAAKRDLAANCF